MTWLTPCSHMTGGYAEFPYVSQSFDCQTSGYPTGYTGVVIRSLRYVNGAYVDSVVTGNSCAAPPAPAPTPTPPPPSAPPPRITTQQVTTGCVANGYPAGYTGAVVRTYTYSNGVLQSDVVSSNTCTAPASMAPGTVIGTSQLVTCGITATLTVYYDPDGSIAAGNPSAVFMRVGNNTTLTSNPGGGLNGSGICDNTSNG